MVFAAKGQLRFQLRPKLHAMEELLLVCLLEQYNPRFFQNYSEEDVLGLLKPLAQKAVAATSRVFEVSMLKRYFLRWDLGTAETCVHVQSCGVARNMCPAGFFPIALQMSNEASVDEVTTG